MRRAGFVVALAASVAAASCQCAFAADPPKRVTGNFTLTATASAPSVPVGQTVTVKVSLVSTGDSDLATPSITTGYPGQVIELDSATASNGGCTPEIKCSLTTVAVGQSADTTFAFKALAPGTVTLDVTATARYLIFSDGAVGANASVTRKASVSFAIVQPSADVGVALTMAKTPKPAVGKPAKAVAVVTSHGPNEAPGTAVSFKVPAGLKLTAISSPQGTCSLRARTCTFAAFGASGSARVTLALVPAHAASYTVTVRVASGQALDPAAGNDVGTLVVTVPTAVKPHRRA